MKFINQAMIKKFNFTILAFGYKEDFNDLSFLIDTLSKIIELMYTYQSFHRYLCYD